MCIVFENWSKNHDSEAVTSLNLPFRSNYDVVRMYCGECSNFVLTSDL